MKKVRADLLLVQKGIATTRAKAQALLMRGGVFVEGRRVDKAGALLPFDAAVTLSAAPEPYVSRGGTKLAGALDAFCMNVEGLRCLDLGASTGGFITDCLLQRGAREVVAVDVGYGQLADKLRKDERVHSMERTNARSLTAEAIGGPADLTVCDASFIGIGKLVSAIARCTRQGGEIVVLVKPQFEADKAIVSKGKGVVRDDAVRAAVVATARTAIEEAGFEVLGTRDSVLAGPKGNREVFVWARRHAG